MRTCFALALAVLGPVALGQTVPIIFPSDADYAVFVAEGPVDSVPSTAETSTGSAVTLSVAGRRDSERVLVINRTANRLAARLVKEVKVAGWSVKAEDFGGPAEVLVLVTQGGAPASVASVTLSQGNRRVVRLVTPESNGEVRFFDFKPGELKYQVVFDRDGRPGETVEGTLRLGSSSDPLEIALPGAPVTAPGAATNTEAAPKADAAPKETTSPIGQLFGFLLGVGAVGALLYAALRYYQRDPDSVNTQLGKLGVQLPRPVDDPTDPVAYVPAGPAAKPAPIVLDPAAADPVVAPASLAGAPALVDASGSSWEIPEGRSEIGREPELGKSFPNESTLSRRHAAITRTGGEVKLEDLGSTNGTFVNGSKLTSLVFLRPGDEVRFGSLVFRYRG